MFPQKNLITLFIMITKRGKTSVVIEKKHQKRWGEKRDQFKSNDSNKSKFTGNFAPKNHLLIKILILEK